MSAQLPVQLIAQAECRFATPGDDGTIEGRAVTFNVVDAYRTEFAPGSMKWAGKSLPLLWNHNPAEVLGSWRQLEMREDGLHVRGKLNLAVAKAQEAYALLKEGDVGGLSIGFHRIRDEARAGGIRRITEARLTEISIVAVPAVPGSGVTAVRACDPSALSALLQSIHAATAAMKG